MRTYAEFITECNHIQLLEDAGDKVAAMSDADFDRWVKANPAAAEKAKKVRQKGVKSPASAGNQSTRTGPYGGEYTPPGVDDRPSKRQAIKDVFNKGKQRVQNGVQGVRDKASTVKKAVTDAASKVANTSPAQAAQAIRDKASTVKKAVTDVASKVNNTTPKQAVDSLKNKAAKVTNAVNTKLKYGKVIKPNSSTSALATRSTDLAKAATTASKLSKGLRIAGRVAGPAAAALDVASERSKGSGWLRSLAKGAVTAAGGALGGAGGSAAGPVGTVVGASAGATAASKAFDVAAGKNAVERAADRLKNRQRQAGGGLVGTGGKTTFDKNKNTMTTGNKTVSLAKTSVVKDPKTGKAETGNLAYKDGKAVYKRAAKPGEGSSNAFERIGRTLNANAYKENDAKLAAQKLNQAKANDATRNKALGIKPQK